MKLPKVLIGAIIAGIAIHTLPSCSKDNDVTPKDKKEAEKKKQENNNYPCPACGMG